MYAEILKLVVTSDRRPAESLPARLHDLFRVLQGARTATEAAEAEDAIWSAWMKPRRGRAADELERATRAIVAADFAFAERVLGALTMAAPDYAEAWNKRATLYYMQSRDDACIASLRRTLELEPRHFGAMCSFGQILLDRDDRAGAAFAFDAALRVNPHLDAKVRETAGSLLKAPTTPPH